MIEPLVPPSEPRKLEQDGGTAFRWSSPRIWDEGWRRKGDKKNQDTLGKRFWQMSTKAAVRRMRTVIRLK